MITAHLVTPSQRYGVKQTAFPTEQEVLCKRPLLPFHPQLPLAHLCSVSCLLCLCAPSPCPLTLEPGVPLLTILTIAHYGEYAIPRILCLLDSCPGSGVPLQLVSLWRLPRKGSVRKTWLLPSEFNRGRGWGKDRTQKQWDGRSI